MRIPKAVLGGFLILVLIAAGIYLLVLDKAPAKPASPDASAAETKTKAETITAASKGAGRSLGLAATVAGILASAPRGDAGQRWPAACEGLR